MLYLQAAHLFNRSLKHFKNADSGLSHCFKSYPICQGIVHLIKIERAARLHSLVYLFFFKNSPEHCPAGNKANTTDCIIRATGQTGKLSPEMCWTFQMWQLSQGKQRTENSTCSPVFLSLVKHLLKSSAIYSFFRRADSKCRWGIKKQKWKFSDFLMKTFHKRLSGHKLGKKWFLKSYAFDSLFGQLHQSI